MIKRVTASFLMFGMLAALPIYAQKSDAVSDNSPVIIVFDASGSMKDKLYQEGPSRMTVARVALEEFVRTLKPSTAVALVAYGNNIPGCDSTRLYVSPVKGSRSTVASKVSRMVPGGGTPLAATLRLVRQSIFPKLKSARVIAITDGLESCGGDPQAEAAQLKASGIPVDFHLLALGVKPNESLELAKVADSASGRYYDIQTSKDLVDALDKIARTPSGGQMIVQESKKPEPKESETNRPTDDSNANKNQSDAIGTTHSAMLKITNISPLGRTPNGTMRYRVTYEYRAPENRDYQVVIHALRKKVGEGPSMDEPLGGALITLEGGTHRSSGREKGEQIIEIEQSDLQKRPIYIQGELWDIKNIPEPVYISKAHSLAE